MPFAADHDEVLSALNELLEAERAGARVALRTAKDVLEPELKSLVIAIQRDEAHWCDVLTKAIHELGFQPSKKTGAFYDKADEVLGPIFAARIDDWEPHLLRMIAFWSSVTLMSGRYHGPPANSLELGNAER